MNGKPLSREPNKVLMYQKHMPYSKGPTLKLANQQMRTWWSSDGKRLMLDIIHFISIVNKFKQSAASAMWSRMKNGKTKIKRDFNFIKLEERNIVNEIMDIADLLELLVEKQIPYSTKFPREDADPFREGIIATVAAFENANKAEEAVSAAASIAQQAPTPVLNDTESDSD
jgi:hypothetical protein